MKNVTKFVAAPGVACAIALGGVAAGASMMDNASAATTISATYVVKGGISLNIRSGPGTNYSKVGKVYGGTKLTGTVTNGWIHISGGSYNGKYASVAWTNKVSSSAPTSTPKPASSPSSSSSTATSVKTVSFYVTKTDYRIRVHSSPSTASAVTATLTPGSRISGVVSGDWLKVSSGYVNRGDLATSPLSNGRLPANTLCGLPASWNSPTSFAPGYTPSTVRLLNCTAAKSLNSLENAYKAKFGHYAQIDLTYRSISEQNYWFSKFGYPRAAIPGTSNHGLGLAVDFRERDVAGEEFGWGGSGWQWLKANGSKYGFTQPFAYGTSGESYHWNFVG